MQRLSLILVMLLRSCVADVEYVSLTCTETDSEVRSIHVKSQEPSKEADDLQLWVKCKKDGRIIRSAIENISYPVPGKA